MNTSMLKTAKTYEQICTLCASVTRCPLKPPKGTPVEECKHWEPRLINGKLVPHTRYVKYAKRR